MKQSNKALRLRRVLCAALTLLLIMSLIAPVGAAGKATKQRAIAIVFDNSGSMYMPSNVDMEQNKAWCRATYAIEVFASMMNDGDILEIYPMIDIEVGSKTYTDQNPLVIDDASEVSQIREIYTPHGGDTPSETITAAYNGLSKHSDKEQWLIVLTDGQIFYENGEIIGGADQTDDEMAAATQAALTEMLSKYNSSVNVMYLGIGKVAAEPQISGAYQHFAVKAADTANVLTELTTMCNMIFGRDALPDAGSTVSFDLPMSKLIIFVQGSDVSDLSFESASGGSAGTVVSEYAPHYSELGAGNYVGRFAVDTNLQGYIQTITDCPAGEYTLNFSGNATSIGIYYEPDVDMVLQLVDEAGNIASGDTAFAGKYKIVYGMMDSEGNPTASPLLGTTDFEITYIHNGTEETITASQAGAIELELAAGDTVDVYAAVTYLSGYHIEKSGVDLGWPDGGFQIATRPAGNLQLAAEGGLDTYKLSSMEENGAYQLTLTYEGEALSGSGLDRAEVSAQLLTESEEDGTDATCAVEQTGDGFTVKLLHAGEPAETKCGDYTLELVATYTNEDNQMATSNAISIPFTVEDDSYGLNMDLDVPQGYIQLSKIDEAKPMIAHLTKDGAPLTDEELAAVNFTCSGDGLAFTTEPIYGESAYEIRFDPSASYDAGNYKFTCKAEATDPLGNQLSAEESGRVEMQAYPQWLRWLLILLIIALIIALILAYLNAKILPKQVSVRSGSTMFNVDGSRVTGNAKCEFTGKNKPRGALSIQLPKCSTSPLAKGGFDLELVAVSPRRTKSSQRRAGVVNLSPINGSAVHTIQVGTATYRKDNDGKWAKVGGKKTAPAKGKGKDKGNAVQFEVANNANCVIAGETIDGTSFSCTCKLQFL